jgi:hypothetical protein
MGSELKKIGDFGVFVYRIGYVVKLLFTPD